MRNIEDPPLAALKLIENVLSKKENLLKLHEARLTALEKFFNYHEAILEKNETSDNDSDEVNFQVDMLRISDT